MAKPGARSSARVTRESAGSAAGVPDAAWPSDGVLRAAVRAAVARKWSLFRRRFPEIGKEDLLSECLMAIDRAKPRYNAATATWSTFVGIVAGRKLLHIHRGLDRRAKREARVAREVDAAARVVEWVDLGDAAGLPGGLGGDDETVEDWAAHVYRHAVAAFPRRRPGRGGRNWFTPAQVLVAMLVMRKLQLSNRAAARRFAADEDLRKAIGLTRVPSYVWFHRAASFVTAKLKIPVRPDLIDGIDGGK